MTKILKCYLASPLGFTESGRQFMYSTMVPYLKKMGIEVLNPWELQDSIDDRMRPVNALDRFSEKVAALSEINKSIGKNNVDAMDEADCIIAVLDGTDVDSGTAVEIGYMYGKGKKCYGYKSDFRTISDNIGSKVNLQVEYFCVGIASTLDALGRLLAKDL